MSKLNFESTINYTHTGEKSISLVLKRDFHGEATANQDFEIEREEIPVLIEILKDYQKTVR